MGDSLPVWESCSGQGLHFPSGFFKDSAGFLVTALTEKTHGLIKPGGACQANPVRGQFQLEGAIAGGGEGQIRCGMIRLPVFGHAKAQ